MLGVVFTEFLEMVEDSFSPEVADALLEQPELKSGGIFTAVGYYTHTDMIRMVVKLSEVTGVPVDDLVEAFGEHLFKQLGSRYPRLLEGHTDTLTFLESVDGTIHDEVYKLYPQAELPRFFATREGPDRLEMVYRSKRPFSRLALGLMKGCASHFGEQLDISWQSADTDENYITTFDIKRHG